MIARLQAESSQGVGQAVDTRIELFVVHSARTVDRRDISRMRCGGRSEQRADVHDSSSRPQIDGNDTIMSDHSPNEEWGSNSKCDVNSPSCVASGASFQLAMILS